MNGRWMMWAVAGILWAASALAVPTGKSIALVAVGDFDPATLKAIGEYVESNTLFPVRILPARPSAGATLEAEAAALTNAVEANDLLLIALVQSAATCEGNTVILQAERIAAINAGALKTDDAQRFLWRMERLALNSAGQILGLSNCPNPLCCLWNYSSLDEMDAMGRNFCPPCCDRFQQAGIRLGGVLIEPEVVDE